MFLGFNLIFRGKPRSFHQSANRGPYQAITPLTKDSRRSP